MKLHHRRPPETPSLVHWPRPACPMRDCKPSESGRKLPSSYNLYGHTLHLCVQCELAGSQIPVRSLTSLSIRRPGIKSVLEAARSRPFSFLNLSLQPIALFCFTSGPKPSTVSSQSVPFSPSLSRDLPLSPAVQGVSLPVRFLSVRLYECMRLPCGRKDSASASTVSVNLTGSLR